MVSVDHDRWTHAAVIWDSYETDQEGQEDQADLQIGGPTIYKQKSEI